MARPTQKRRKSARTNARAGTVDGRPRPVSRQPARLVEDTMFFPRLRRQAKWMFVLLALVFGGGFVIFGVGSNLPSGLGDVLRDVQHTDTPSVDDARDRVRENPKDPDAHRDLATALQQNQRPDEAIAPLERYVKMRPRDENALRELGGLYSSKTNRLEREVAIASIDVQASTTGSLVAPNLGDEAQGFFQQGAIEQAASTEANERYSELAGELDTTADKAFQTYRKLARLAPRDAQLQLLIANSAEKGNNPKGAIAAYQRFLKLAPEDSSAPTVRDRIKALKEQLNAPATPTISPVSSGG
jgi:tetratricopeptide (TPR) repeat protein